jgi:prevent-host-death family protein
MVRKRRSSGLVSATQFRSNLFEYLKQAKAGEDVTVQHKGCSFRIVPVLQPSKLARLAALPPLDVIEGDWEEFVRCSEELSKDMQNAWQEKWDRRLRK